MKAKEKFPKIPPPSKNFSLTRDYFQPSIDKSTLIFTKPKGQSFHLTRDLNATSSSLVFKKPEKNFLETLKTPIFSLKSNQNPNDISRKIQELRKASKKLEFLLKKTEMKRLEAFLSHISALIEGINKDFAEKILILESQIPQYERFLDFQISFYNQFREICIDLLLKAKHLQKNEQNAIERTEQIKEITPTNDEKTPKEIEFSLLKLENARLQKALEDVSKQILQNENKNDRSQNVLDQTILHSNIEKHSHINEEKEKDFEKVLFSKQQIIQNYKTMVNRLEKENNDLKLSIESMRTGFLEMKSQNHKLETDVNQYFEIALMQQEETNGVHKKCDELGVFSRKLKEKIESLNAKVGKLTGNRIENPENPNEKDFHLDLSLFSLVRKSLQDKDFKKPKKSPFLALYNKEEIARNREKVAKLALRIGTGNQDEASEDDFSKFTLTKPAFFTFLEHKFQSYSNEIHAERPNRISGLFLATIRGILDAKYIEFRSESNWKLIKKFPEFVYTWLGSFQTMGNLKQVVFLNKQERNHADDFRIMFLIDITNPKLQKLWEVVTFKDFLEEKSQLDELYFYLHCRSMLLSGLETADMNFFQDLIHYVSLDHCYDVLDNVFLSFEKPVLDFIRNKLKEKGGKMTLNGLLIDSAYALRLFLEFYKSEKARKLNMIKDLFHSFHSFEVPGTNSLSNAYQNFKKIMEAFNEYTEQETAEFYRKVWNFGNGAVNFDSFLAIADEENFFLRTLKLRSQMPVPLKLDFEKNIDQTDELYWEASELLNAFDSMTDEFEFLEKTLETHGCLEIFQQLVAYKRLVLGKLQMNADEIKAQEIVELFLSWLGEVLKGMKVALFTVQGDEKVRRIVIGEGLKFVGNVLGGMRKVWEDKRRKWEEERNRKARKLQGFFKKKVSKWYTLLSSLLGPKVKKTANYRKRNEDGR